MSPPVTARSIVTLPSLWLRRDVGLLQPDVGAVLLMSDVNVASVLVLSACTFDVYGDENCCKRTTTPCFAGVFFFFTACYHTGEAVVVFKKKGSFYWLFTARSVGGLIWRLVCGVFAFLHLGDQLWKNNKDGVKPRRLAVSPSATRPTDLWRG